MNFLNAILLAGAAAFVIPLLIHLLNKRKIQTVRWGAMHLLQEVLKQRKRRFRIEQWLLLMTRIAIPIVLALCLARPVMSALNQIPGFGKTSAAFILDDSFSMRTPLANGTAAGQSRQDIQRIMDNLPKGSDAQVILAGGRPRPLMDQSTSQLDLLAKRLADAPSLSGPLNANELFQTAGAALKDAPNAAREMVVISDFQESDWKSIVDGAGLPALAALQKQEPKPQITFFRVPTELGENLSIGAAELSALVAAETQPIGLRVRVENHGKRPWQDVVVHLEADGARLRTSRISVPPEGEASLSFTHAFDKVGDHTLAVRIEGDSFPEDNAFYTVVQVRNQLNALLVDGAPSDQPLAGSTDFLEIALAPHRSASASLKDLVRTTRTDIRKLRDDDLKGKEVIIIANVERMNRLNELERFVNDGGGLLVFVGPKCDVDWYNREFFKGGKGIFPAALKGYGHVEENENPARVLLQRFLHPSTAYFNDPRSGRLQDAEFRHWIQFVPAADQSRALLSLDRGIPLVVEKAHGRGRVIAVATTANPEWSNLPLQPFFVPLAQRLVTYLATQSTAPAWQLVGAPIQLNLKKEQADMTYTVTDSLGKVEEYKARKEGETAVLESKPIASHGIYELKAKDSPNTPSRYFAFNVNPAESDLKALTSDQVKKMAERFGAGFADSFESYEKLDRTRRHGVEFWQPFLLALLVLLFLEVLLQQRIARG
jgi:hypothetical protein